jgi:lysophospholipase L1-like esterase
MRKILLITLVLVVIGFAIYALFFASDPRRIKNYPSFGTRVIAFGDSLIEGVGASEGNDFISLLSQKLATPIENYGRGGDTTATALERLPRVLEEVPNPKVVIILLGGNDFLRKIPKEETFANLSTIIESFQERDAVVLLLGIRGGIFKDNFEKEFEELHDIYQTAYISNVLRGLITNRKLMFDSIHPNDAGYKKIADKVYPILKEISQ